MKKAVLPICLSLMCLSFQSPAQNVDLTSFGTNDYLVDGVSTTATYSQTASTLTFNYSPSFGDTIGGQTVTGGTTPVTLNWSAYTNSVNFTGFGLTMSLTGTNNNVPFTLLLLDDTFSSVASYQGSTAGLSITPGITPLTFVPGGNDNFSNIAGIQFTWDTPGGQSVNTTVSTLVAVAVPEPSTYALLTLASLGLGGYAVRRRLRG